MRLIVLSDTHLKTGTIPEKLLPLLDASELIIHAGDFSSAAAYEAFAASGKLKAVFGNTDDFEIRKKLPEKQKFEIEGVRIGLVHEGGLSITDTTSQYYLAKEMGVDVLIFGHLHRPLIEKGDVVLICPGSPTNPRMSEPSVVELIINNGSVSGRVISLGGSVCGFMKFQDSLSEKEKPSERDT
ncbi:MAG: metallophosphoesterase [Methanosarcinaceae archaeon]|nr:metallophosphoesterase [Methanosarcinaceae archaeon]